MKLYTFNYTKKDGSISERLLLAMGSPTNKYSGIDLSELEPDNAVKFASEVERLHEQYVQSLKQLQAQYDVKHNYRQFNEEGVTELTEI